MKRALLITGGTVAGISAVLSFTPAQLTSASSSISPSSGDATINSGAASDVTVTGRGYNAGGFGTVSVQITVTNGVVTAAKAVSYPNRDNRSAWISQQAIPWLVEQTLAAKDSANVAGVGGATYTSGAWINSLQSALTAAGL